jgi:membrane protease YdiL (CAAX protease family)
MRSYPTIGQAIILLVILFLIVLFLGIPIGIIDYSTHLKLSQHPLTIGIINSIAFGIVIFIGFKRASKPKNILFPLKKIRIVSFIPIILTTVGLSIILSDLDNLLQMILPMPDFIFQFFSSLVSSDVSIWFSLFALSIVAPLTEEFLFRGVILNGFLNNYSVKKAVIISALLFGIFHLNPWQFMSALMAGILFAWWFIKTYNLSICIAGHAIFNALPIIFIRIFHIKIPGFTADMNKFSGFQPLWLDLLGLILLISGIYLSIRLFEKPTVEQAHEDSY